MEPEIDAKQGINMPLPSAADERYASNPWDFYLDEMGLQLEDTNRTIKSADIESQTVWMSIPGERLNRIWELLRPLCKSSSLPMDTVTSFFSSRNIKTFLDLFWKRWYPHCPILHRPTFEIAACPDILLITMTLVGACMSDVSSDCQSARSLLDTVETLVFFQTIFSDPTPSYEPADELVDVN